MTDLDLIAAFYLAAPRQGPGSEADTLHALALTRLDKNAQLTVADIGCGTGAQTRALARALPHAKITAVDLLQPFLDRLIAETRAEGLSAQITPLKADMAALPFAPESLDLIWSEGAIYNIGFKNGLARWRSLLKPRGLIALSEITYLTATPPAALLEFWEAAYPEIGTAAEKHAALEAAGYTPMGYFPLSRNAWFDSFYTPLQQSFAAFRADHKDTPAATALTQEMQNEIDLISAHMDQISYGFYIARKSD